MRGKVPCELAWPERSGHGRAGGSHDSERRRQETPSAADRSDKRMGFDQELPVDENLFAALEEEARRDRARPSGNVPRFLQIFSDETLKAFARLKPTDFATARRIRGVGEYKGGALPEPVPRGHQPVHGQRCSEASRVAWDEPKSREGGAFSPFFDSKPKLLLGPSGLGIGKRLGRNSGVDTRTFIFEFAHHNVGHDLVDVDDERRQFLQMFERGICHAMVAISQASGVKLRVAHRSEVERRVIIPQDPGNRILAEVAVKACDVTEKIRNRLLDGGSHLRTEPIHMRSPVHQPDV